MLNLGFCCAFSFMIYEMSVIDLHFNTPFALNGTMDWFCFLVNTSYWLLNINFVSMSQSLLLEKKLRLFRLNKNLSHFSN